MNDALKVVAEQKLSFNNPARVFAKPSLFIPLLSLLILALCQGCSTSGRVVPTRTPLPTWTSTPSNGVAVAVEQNTQVESSVPQATVAVISAPTNTPVPPTAAPIPTATPLPTDTPLPTFTPTPTALPTATNTPVPTPTPDFAFDLESAEKFPTESLAQNIVRVFIYVYSPIDLALADYTIAVTHDGKALTVDAASTAGLPEQTRVEPSAYTRFTNLNVIFVEPQAGEWSVQLQDAQGNVVGPKADFELTEDEITRELYVRYRSR